MLSFDLNSPAFAVERERYILWQKEHYQKGKCPLFDDGTSPACPSGAIGGRVTFSLTPTSVGLVMKVSCGCGKKDSERDLTDYDSW